jgi:quercetin dioxygenase-like cupin family protein
VDGALRPNDALRRKKSLRRNAGIQGTRTRGELAKTRFLPAAVAAVNILEKESCTMSKQATFRKIALAGLVVGTLGLGNAIAGECPADKRVAAGQGQKPGPTTPKGVADKVLNSTDLATQPIAVKDRLFRSRRLDIEPGGIVPWHSHTNRPAMIYVVSGQVTEYASTCAVPIVHKASEITAEAAPTSHWWQNHGKTTAVLISVDIFQVEDRVNEKMM